MADRRAGNSRGPPRSRSRLSRAERAIRDLRAGIDRSERDPITERIAGSAETRARMRDNYAIDAAVDFVVIVAAVARLYRVRSRLSPFFNPELLFRDIQWREWSLGLNYAITPEMESESSWRRK